MCVSICLDGSYPQLIIQSILPLISLKLSPYTIKCIKDIFLYNFVTNSSSTQDITTKRFAHRKLSLAFDKSDGIPQKRKFSILDVSKREILMNKVNVLLSFGLPNFNILLIDENQIKVRGILELNINEIDLTLINRNYDTSILFNMGSFQITTNSNFSLIDSKGLIDCFHHLFIYLGNGTTSFINSNFQFISLDSPSYANVDSSLDV